MTLTGFPAAQLPRIPVCLLNLTPAFLPICDTCILMDSFLSQSPGEGWGKA